MSTSIHIFQRTYITTGYIHLHPNLVESGRTAKGVCEWGRGMTSKAGTKATFHTEQKGKSHLIYHTTVKFNQNYTFLLQWLNALTFSTVYTSALPSSLKDNNKTHSPIILCIVVFFAVFCHRSEGAWPA